MSRAPVKAGVQSVLLVAAIQWGPIAEAGDDNALISSTAPPNWTTAWAASPTELSADAQNLWGHSIVQRMKLTASGNSVRIRISNDSKQSPFRVNNLAFEAVPISFAGRAEAVLAPGETRTSDVIAHKVMAGDKVSISLFIPQQATPPTIHWYGRETALVYPGDFKSDISEFSAAHQTDHRITVTSVEVLTESSTGVIAVLGDSITDGSRATPNLDYRWPDRMWELLRSRGIHSSVANAGIGGDRLLRAAGRTGSSPGALRRLERDVFALSSVSMVIVAVGVNDIAWPGASLRGELLAANSDAPLLEDMASGYSQIIQRCRDQGIIVVGATITPFKGQSEVIKDFWSEKKERQRQEINAWIRNEAGFDAVIDFDVLLRSSASQQSLSPAYDSGDGVHPNDLGFAVMGVQAAEVVAELLGGL